MSYLEIFIFGIQVEFLHQVNSTFDGGNSNHFMRAIKSN